MNSSKAAIVVSQIIEKLQLIAGIIITILFGITPIASIGDKKTNVRNNIYNVCFYCSWSITNRI